LVYGIEQMFGIEKAAEALEEAASSVDVDALDGT
jgi:hypothetical protein